jgi:predicted nucleotidyltransferase
VVRAWNEFESLGREMVDSGGFSPTSLGHRFLHVSGFQVDFVPFAGVEDPSRHIAWPPRGEVRMDVFGLQEAFGSAIDVMLPFGVRTRVVSLPALLLLKLVAWSGRHFSTPGKDAHDIWLIVTNYMECGGRERLFAQFTQWLDEADFDNERAGARMLGLDIAALLNAEGRARMASLVAEEASVENPGALPGELCRRDPDRARGVLRALLGGLRFGGLTPTL